MPLILKNCQVTLNSLQSEIIMKIKLLVFCFSLIISSWGGSANLDNTEASAASITLTEGQSQLQISLPANPTTGYRWTVISYDKSLFHLDTSKFLPPDSKLIGAGGTMVFNFTILKQERYPKSSTLCFSYARLWEHKSGSLKKIAVYFK